MDWYAPDPQTRFPGEEEKGGRQGEREQVGRRREGRKVCI
jgi:hypothetical protein